MTDVLPDIETASGYPVVVGVSTMGYNLFPTHFIPIKAIKRCSHHTTGITHNLKAI